MNKLVDIIENKPILKRLYKMLELGIVTTELKLLSSHLQDFEVTGEDILEQDVLRFSKYVTDDMMSCGYSIRDIQSISNIVNIYGLTAVSVQTEEDPVNDINIGFASRFYDYAKNCFEKERQSLGVKILIKELLTPNSFFIRTLDIFFRVDKFEMDWFFEITKYVYDKSCLPDFLLTGNKFYPFNQFQTLVDAGFVNAPIGHISYDESFTMHFHNVEVIISILQSPLGLGIYTLTDAGSQLLDLAPSAPTDDYLNKLKEIIERNNRAKVESINRK